MGFLSVINEPAEFCEILSMLKLDADVSDINLTFQKGRGLQVSLNGKDAFIEYESNYAYRGLMLLCEKLNAGVEDFQLKEEIKIPYLGAMYDVSRNQVMNIEYAKYRMRLMALMGYNRFMLYTEDMYEIPGYPYFGHLRGRYAKEEIGILDEYARLLGMEMMPCMQAAAHLEHFFKWWGSGIIRDADNCLLVGEEKTYELLEAEFKFISESFRCKNVLICMDETDAMGKGQYFAKHGYRKQIDIYREHLQRVKNIAKKYDLFPIIFDDMFIKNASKVSSGFDHEAPFPKRETGFIPEGVDLIYWDYYNTDAEHYAKMFQNHREAGYEPKFMGGSWTWGSPVVPIEYTFKRSEAALKACVSEEISEVWLSYWFDNGGDTDYSAIEVLLMLYVEYAFGHQPTIMEAFKRLENIKGMSAEMFYDIENLEQIKPYEGSKRCETPGMTLGISWQDTLYGLMDKCMEHADFKSHYTEALKRLERHIGKVGENEELLQRYITLCKLCLVKHDISIRLKAYYESGKKKELLSKAKDALKEVQEAVLEAKNAHRKLWFKHCKPFGWEIFDLRYGSVISRCETALWRIEEYCKGNINSIEELEAPRLYFAGDMEGNPLGGNEISSSGFFWEMASAGQI